MADKFRLNFSTESEEEDDDFWKNKKKFSRPIFSESDEEQAGKEASVQVVQEAKKPLQSKLIPGSLGNEPRSTEPVKKSIQTEEAKKSIGTTFLQLNPVSNRVLSSTADPSQTKGNNDIFDSSITSTTSSTTSSSTFGSELSVRSKNPEPEVRAPILQPPVPRPKFTMPATVIKNAAFNQAPKVIRENIELKTVKSKLEAELKLLNSKSYRLDLYKSKRDKTGLLKEAIESHDGNAILAVVLFIKQTLNQDTFHGILINNPIALNQYIFYLEQMNDQKELAAFHKYHGNLNESAAIKYFKPILCEPAQEVSDKLALFHEFERAYSNVEVHLINNYNMLGSVKKYLKLLQVQKDIVKNNSAFLRKDIKRQNAMDALKQSVLSYTLSFCLKYSKELNDNESYSVEHLRKEFDLNAKQFSIWFIKAMSEIGAWSELEAFTKQRGLFNMVKSPSVGYETIVFIIAHVKGPQEQIRKYLNQVENIERRQDLAMKFSDTDVVIETFKLQRDKIGLLNFRNMFRENTPDYIKANIVIMDDKIKWKG